MMYDFYYSAKHEVHMKKLCAMAGRECPDTWIRGMKYTEMIKSGKEPLTNHFDDIEKICTADGSKVIVY